MEEMRTTLSPSGSAVSGFIILILSFFTMPVRTLKITIRELKEVSGTGQMDIESTNIPHLSWLDVAGHLLTSIVIVIIIAAGILFGILSLAKIGDSATRAIGGLILFPVVGVFIAILADWLMSITLELLSLWTGMANDIRKMKQKITSQV